MRIDFELGAFKFLYIDPGQEDSANQALTLFKEMTDQISKVLPAEIVQALVAADPAVVAAMKAAAIRDFSQKFDEQVIQPISAELQGLESEESEETEESESSESSKEWSAARKIVEKNRRIEPERKNQTDYSAPANMGGTINRYNRQTGTWDNDQ